MIPLGILGNRRGAGAAGAYELISTAYGTGSAADITFSSIPSTYKHLQIRGVAQAGQTTNLSVRYNNDSGSNYSLHRLEGNGTAVSSAGGGPYTLIEINNGVSQDTITNAVSATILDILDYSSTTKNKTQRVLNGAATNANRIGLYSGLWMNTGAISSITLLSGTGTFTTKTRFSLYGIK